ncbi:MAG: DKNYY domain-containing protein [Patescibacteria group bacterium]|nr:DKNYY domain-containing protein [Patescibacteria group bacterium]
MKKIVLLVISFVLLLVGITVLSACSVKLPSAKQSVDKKDTANKTVETGHDFYRDLETSTCNTNLNAWNERFCYDTENCRALWKNICPGSETISFNFGKFDVETFELICGRDTAFWSGVVKDKNGVYLASTTYPNVEWEHVNPETFKNYNCTYFKDGDKILSLPPVLPLRIAGVLVNVSGADSETFETIKYKHTEYGQAAEDFHYAKDKNNAYYMGLIILGADPASFKIIDFIYSKDKNNVYYVVTSPDKPVQISKIQGVDVKSFKIFDDYISIDKNNVYCGASVLKGADVKTFRKLASNEKNERSGDYCDKNNCYWANCANINSRQGVSW